MERKGLGKNVSAPSGILRAPLPANGRDCSCHLSTLQTHSWAARRRDAWTGSCCLENPSPCLPSICWPKSKAQAKQPAPLTHTQDQQPALCPSARVETTSDAIHLSKNESPDSNSRLAEREHSHHWWGSLASFRSGYRDAGLPCRAVTSRSLCAGTGTCQHWASMDPLALREIHPQGALQGFEEGGQLGAPIWRRERPPVPCLGPVLPSRRHPQTQHERRSAAKGPQPSWAHPPTHGSVTERWGEMGWGWPRGKGGGNDTRACT